MSKKGFTTIDTSFAGKYLDLYYDEVIKAIQQGIDDNILSAKTPRVIGKRFKHFVNQLLKYKVVTVAWPEIIYTESDIFPATSIILECETGQILLQHTAEIGKYAEKGYEYTTSFRLPEKHKEALAKAAQKVCPALAVSVNCER